MYAAWRAAKIIASSADELDGDEEADDEEEIVLKEEDELEKEENMMLCQPLSRLGVGEFSFDWETFGKRFYSK